MKTCSCCHRPLTEFETLFHQKALSNPSLSSQCWKCSGAEKTFGKPLNYSRQIYACLIGYAIFACYVIFYYFAEKFINIHSINSVNLISNIILISGSIPTLTIFFFNKTNTSDPQDAHYTDNSSTSDVYISRDGPDNTIITEKTTQTTSSSKNNWSSHVFIKIIITYFAVATFIYWGLPYIIYAIYRQTGIRYFKLNDSTGLFSVYRETRKEYTKVPLTFQNKVSFLKEREKHTQNIREKQAKNNFMDKYIQTPYQIEYPPYKVIYINNIPHMIVDYHKGVSFLILKKSPGNFEMRMSTGDSYIDSNPYYWLYDWKSAGAKPETISKIEIYISILNNNF